MEQNPKPKNPWRYILFYYDPADPRILVPKQIPDIGLDAERSAHHI
jgi:uncharacterized membrane protein